MSNGLEQLFSGFNFKEAVGMITIIAGSVFGIDKWRRIQEKNKAKAGEITNTGLKIENKKKVLDIEKIKVESLMVTIEQLKKDNENFGKRIDKLQKELQEVYKQLDELRDENLKLENELYKCKKNRIND